MITIASTFVAEPLELPLGWLLRQAGVQDSIEFAPYNQVFQELLTPTSLLRGNTNGVNVVLIRLEDFVRDLSDKMSLDQKIDSIASELAQAFEEFASHSKQPLVAVVLPPSSAAPEHLVNHLVAAGDIVKASIRNSPKAQLLDNSSVGEASFIGHHDATRDHLAHIPYTEDYYSTLALLIARAVHAAKNAPSKVLVLDCDNTIWRGVVGEDGVEGIQITAPYIALQDFSIELQRKGILICLASKNVEADVLSVLETRSDMHLKQSHVVSHRVNWLSKPANIRSLSQELNLGLDSFVFLDDNPVECAQMRAELPEVITLQVPEESGYLEFLANLWMFDKLSVTAEDAARTKMYRENVARRATEQSTSDIEQFIATLDMKIDVAVPSADEWPRLEQLTQRTNQFNFTTRRRSAAELSSLLESGAPVFRVRVSDRFGDYGIVGLAIGEKSDDELRVDTFLLSCRVLGRGVEHAMLRRLGEAAQIAGLEQVSLVHIPTPRNVPARAFADSVAASYVDPDESAGRKYLIPASIAAQIEHRPGHDPAEVIAARDADEKKTAAPSSGVSADRSERYSRIAHKLRSGTALMAEMAQQPLRARGSRVAATIPTSELQIQLVRLWESLLKIDGVGIDDDFFDLGGTSLLSVTLFAEIAQQFKAQLPLSAIVEAPTVRLLSRLIDAPNSREHEGIICLRSGGPRHLFLVHDGLGETLLYHNLAMRLPAGFTVYGVEPKRLPGIPLASTSISSMARLYVERIMKIQPEGPYLLGGMCAGGVIAYEMAACLDALGAPVELVIVMDGATPQAQKKTGYAAQQRLLRLKKAMSSASQRPLLSRLVTRGWVFARKATNTAFYMLTSRWNRASVFVRIVLMKSATQRGTPWPKFVTPLKVMEIYGVLESEYQPPALNVPVLLVRATQGEGADTPYRDMYAGDDFGWASVTGRLRIVDVDGGHASMLQEQSVGSLVSSINKQFITPTQAQHTEATATV